MTTTTVSMAQLVAIAKDTVTKALQESREVICGVSMPEKDRSDFIYQKMLSAVFDAIGYKFPVDPEREAFDRWITTTGWDVRDSTYEAWKAGREELRKAQMPSKQPENDGWIPWGGGATPPSDMEKIIGVRFRSGSEKIIPYGRSATYFWSHDGSPEDIIAYKITQTTPA